MNLIEKFDDDKRMLIMNCDDNKESNKVNSYNVDNKYCDNLNMIELLCNEDIFSYNIYNNCICIKCMNIIKCRDYINKLRMRLINMNFVDDKESKRVINSKNVYKMKDDELSIIKLNYDIIIKSDKVKKIKKKYLDCVDVIKIE